MTTDIPIPEEAVEAAARVLATCYSTEHDWELFEPRARAALQAGLRAWPGVNEAEVETPDGSRWLQSIILPLPQEKQDE